MRLYGKRRNNGTLLVKSHRLGLFLQQRNSAKRAIWSEDHSGEGSAVSFLKLSSSNNSNNDSTTNESAEKQKIH